MNGLFGRRLLTGLGGRVLDEGPLGWILRKLKHLDRVSSETCLGASIDTSGYCAKNKEERKKN